MAVQWRVAEGTRGGILVEGSAPSEPLSLRARARRGEKAKGRRRQLVLGGELVRQLVLGAGVYAPGVAA